MNKIILPLLLLLLTMCSYEELSQKKSLILPWETTLANDSLKVYLDTKTSFDPYFIQVDSIKGEAYFVFHNFHLNSLDYYSVETGKFEKRLVFEREGANKINPLNGYVRMSDDALIIFGKYHLLETKIANNEGQIIQANIFTKEDLDPTKLINIICTNLTFPTFTNNTIFFTAYPFVDFNNTNSYQDIFYDFKISLREKKLDSIPFHLPIWMDSKKWPIYSLINRRAFNSKDREIINAWPFDFNLYVYDIAKDFEIQKIKVKNSKFTENKDLNFNQNRRPEEFMRQNTHVFNIAYNSESETIYRVILQGENRKPDQMDYQYYHDMNTTIELINSSYEVIKVIHLEKKKYDPTFLIPYKKGILIPRTNIHFKIVNEDVLIFDYYE